MAESYDPDLGKVSFRVIDRPSGSVNLLGCCFSYSAAGDTMTSSRFPSIERWALELGAEIPANEAALLKTNSKIAVGNAGCIYAPNDPKLSDSPSTRKERKAGRSRAVRCSAWLGHWVLMAVGHRHTSESHRSFWDERGARIEFVQEWI